MQYNVSLKYMEFRDYMCEDYPLGDRCFHEVFDNYVNDGFIEIVYKYGDYANGKSEILWRLADTEGHKFSKVRYGGSSVFAMWWCGQTDGLEDEEDEELCMKCNTKHEGNWCPEAEEDEEDNNS
jgi:hypothetical protein